MRRRRCSGSWGWDFPASSDDNALGARGGRSGLAAGLLAEAWPEGEEMALRLLAAWVAGRVGLSGLDELHRSSRTAGARARTLVACLAVDHRLCPAARVARYVGRAKATLCEQMGAARQRPEDRRFLEVDPALILAGVVVIRAQWRRDHGPPGANTLHPYNRAGCCHFRSSLCWASRSSP